MGDSLGLVAASLKVADEIAAAAAAAPDLSGDDLVGVSGDGVGAAAAQAVAALVERAVDVALPEPYRRLHLGGDDSGIEVGPSGLVDRVGFGPLVAGAVKALDGGTDVTAAAGHLRDRAGELAGDRAPHHRWVRRIGRTFPLFYGAGPLGAAAARYAKLAATLNAKVFSSWAATPALAYDDVCSWGQHGDVTRQVFTAVLFRGLDAPSGDIAMLDKFAELLPEFVGDVIELEVSGDSPLTQILDAGLLIEQLTLAMALREELDPAPTPGLEWRV